MMRRALLLWPILALALASLAAGQQVPVREVELDNGMRILLVPRPGDPMVAAGWIARVGSVDERPGITGISHLFEHMMFKGTRTIGTKDIEADLRIQARWTASARRCGAIRTRRPISPHCGPA